MRSILPCRPAHPSTGQLFSQLGAGEPKLGSSQSLGAATPCPLGSPCLEDPGPTCASRTKDKMWEVFKKSSPIPWLQRHPAPHMEERGRK